MGLSCFRAIRGWDWVGLDGNLCVGLHCFAVLIIFSQNIGFEGFTVVIYKAEEVILVFSGRTERQERRTVVKKLVMTHRG